MWVILAYLAGKTPRKDELHTGIIAVKRKRRVKEQIMNDKNNDNTGAAFEKDCDELFGGPGKQDEDDKDTDQEQE